MNFFVELSWILWVSSSEYYTLEVKHKNCSWLEESMKLGTKIHLGMEKSNRLRGMRKSL